MAGHYSPKHFLRQVPKPLLKTFFDRRGELQDIQWSEAGGGGRRSNLRSLAGPARGKPEYVERWFRAVAELATPEGLQTLIEEGQFHGVDLTVCLGQLKGVHEKVFWVYLNHEDLLLGGATEPCRPPQWPLLAASDGPPRQEAGHQSPDQRTRGSGDLEIL